MNPFLGFRIGSPAPDVLVLQEVPYTLVGWILLGSAIFMGATAWYRHRRFETPKGTLVALLGASTVCVLVSLLVLGVRYQYTFQRRESVIVIQQSWFGWSFGSERLTYTDLPTADVVTDKNRRQLILRFADGHIERLGLSTDRIGHERAAHMINDFLQTGSVPQ